MTDAVLDVRAQAPAKLMKAIVRTKCGPPDVLQFKEVEKPVPNDVRGVLVEVYAASVNPADRYDMRGPPSFLLRLEAIKCLEEGHAGGKVVLTV